jgi:tetratricopeptide repeat protein
MLAPMEDMLKLIWWATSLNNVAALYRAQGRYSDAEPLQERAVAIFEKALGRSSRPP